MHDRRAGNDNPETQDGGDMRSSYIMPPSNFKAYVNQLKLPCFYVLFYLFWTPVDRWRQVR
jgi:hypothetical protein